jgi:hypothetical protein
MCYHGLSLTKEYVLHQSIMTKVMNEQLENWGSIPDRSKSILFSIAHRLALRPTHPSIHWVLGTLSLEVKWSGHEGNHSPLSNVEVNPFNTMYRPDWFGILVLKLPQPIT